MNTLYVATTFHPKMVERNLLTIIEETKFDNFKKTLIKSGQYYAVKFAITNEPSIDRLIELLNISIGEGEIVGESIESEEVKCGDIVLLAAPTQSSIFRYFVLTFHKKTNRSTKKNGTQKQQTFTKK